MRFSVKVLLCAMALSAVMVHVLLGANEKSLRLIGTTTFLLSITAATFACFGSGKVRVFAIGFLVGCLPYVYLVFGGNGASRRYLATEIVLEILDKEYKLAEPRKTPAGETVALLSNGSVSVSTPRGFGGTRTITMTWDDAKRLGHTPYLTKQDLLPRKDTFMLIGHFVAALIFGIAVGSLAVFIHKPSEPQRASPGSP